MTELLMREFVHHVPDFTDQSFLKEYNVLKIAALTTTSSVRLVVANLALKEPLSRLILDSVLLTSKLDKQLKE
jgi:hydroxymethylpyrimidine/phosphomethylpyrimidine kinase